MEQTEVTSRWDKITIHPLWLIWTFVLAFVMGMLFSDCTTRLAMRPWL